LAAPARDNGTTAPTVGRPVLDLAARTADGRNLTLADLVGRRVWLTFGASWCQPSRVLDGDIEVARDRLDVAGITVVAVYMGEDEPTIAAYARRAGLSFTMIADPDRSLARTFRVVGIPSHYLIDETGVLRDVRVGTLDPLTVERTLGGG
jgi:peroxiredoxin